MGARALFGDEKLIPVRGQLEVLLPQPEIDYGYLGGTYEPNNWSLEINPAQSTRILNTHSEMMKGFR